MNTWILIADGSRAAVYSRSADGRLEPLKQWDKGMEQTV